MLDVAEAMGTARHAALLLASEWLACSHVFSSDDFPILGLAGSVLTGCISNNFIQFLFVLTLTDIFLRLRLRRLRKRRQSQGSEPFTIVGSTDGHARHARREKGSTTGPTETVVQKALET